MKPNSQVFDCIHKRRSTRQFTTQQISHEHLEALLDAAIWAPSGGNNQSWLFTAIQKQEVLRELNDLVCAAFQHWVPDDDYAGKHAMKRLCQHPGYSFYYNAPTLIIASNRPNYANAMADCALAQQNIFLAASALDLGSCYINQLHWLSKDPTIRAFLERLGIPREHIICCAAAIGHCAKIAPPPERRGGTIQIIR